MKTHKKTLFFTLCSLLVFIVSCESHQQPVDAFELLKKEKQSAKAQVEPRDTIEKKTETKPSPETDQKSVNNDLDSWAILKAEIYQKITENEVSIKDIKRKTHPDSKTLKKIISLERENNDLRQQLTEFIEEEEMHRAVFKAKINQEISTIAFKLKDATIAH